MRVRWMGTVAVAALLAGTIGAAAQVPAEQKQDTPSATKTLPDAGAPKSSGQAPAAAQNGSSGSAQGSSAQRARPTEQDTGIKSTQSEKPGSDQPRSTTQTKEKSPPTSASQSKDSKDAKDTKDSAQSRDGDKQRASEKNRDDRDKQRASDRDRDNQRAGDRDRDSQRAGSRDRDQDGQRAGTRERDSDRRDRADDDSGRKGDRVQFSERERTTIRESVNIDRARVDVNFNVSVGATAPRNVNLLPLPVAIVDLNPRYRNFRYVVVQDEIVIINPQTYTVVEVIPVGGSSRASTTRRGGSVQLSSQQRQRILTYARAECQSVLTTEPDFDLTVGIRIPERIELCPFEDVVVREVGVVQPYRFFVVQNQVVLVDPADHTIVEVIR